MYINCMLPVLLQLIFAIAVYCGTCYLAREHRCRCYSKTISCERSAVSLDIALPRIVPINTQEIIMRRVWVDKAVELRPKHFVLRKQLRRIDFSTNRISVIHAGTFCDLEILEYMSLSYNRLKLLDPDTFKGSFPRFKELDLSHNKLLVLTDHNFHSLGNLKKLDLRGNPILHLPPKAFSGLSKMEYLRFSKSNFTRIPRDALKIPESIRLLELRQMPHLSTIPNHAFRKNIYLRTLILEEIALSSGGPAHGAFDGLGNLENLTLKSCNLTSVPRIALNRAGNLTMLDISNNPIQIIHPGDFTTLTKLRILILHHTGLMEIKVEAFSEQQQLYSLDLSHNILKTLYRDTFARNISSLSTLKLANNLWSCDCSLEWIARSAIFMGKKKVTCAGPEGVMGKSLSEIGGSNGNSYCEPPGNLNLSMNYITVPMGKRAVLPCPYNSSRHPEDMITYTWYHNNVILPVQTIDQKNTSQLVLNEVLFDDSGQYDCVIRTSGGRTLFKVYLTVTGNRCSLLTPGIISGNFENSGNSDYQGATTSSTTLVGVLSFVITLGVVGVFVFVGCWWSKMKANKHIPNAPAIENNGNVFHRISKPKSCGKPFGKGVVLGGHDIYSKPIDDLSRRKSQMKNSFDR